MRVLIVRKTALYSLSFSLLALAAMGWGKPHIDRNAGGGKLEIDGKPVTEEEVGTTA